MFRDSARHVRRLSQARWWSVYSSSDSRLDAVRVSDAPRTEKTEVTPGSPSTHPPTRPPDGPVLTRPRRLRVFRAYQGVVLPEGGRVQGGRVRDTKGSPPPQSSQWFSSLKGPRGQGSVSTTLAPEEARSVLESVREDQDVHTLRSIIIHKIYVYLSIKKFDPSKGLEPRRNPPVCSFRMPKTSFGQGVDTGQ